MTNETIIHRALCTHKFAIEAELEKVSTGRDLEFNALMTKCGAPAHAFRKITAIAQCNFFQRMVELSTVRAMLDEMVKFDETFYYSNRAETYRAEAAAWQLKLDAIDEAANAEEDERVARAEARDYQKVEDCHR